MTNEVMQCILCESENGRMIDVGDRARAPVMPICSRCLSANRRYSASTTICEDETEVQVPTSIAALSEHLEVLKKMTAEIGSPGVKRENNKSGPNQITLSFKLYDCSVHIALQFSNL